MGTEANSQDGSSLEIVTAAAARECNIQDERGRGLSEEWRLLVEEVIPQIAHGTL